MAADVFAKENDVNFLGYNPQEKEALFEDGDELFTMTEKQLERDMDCVIISKVQKESNNIE
ncbi:hypothetical protein ACFL5H_02765 [Candidatus Latescibacterota bacterium]